MKYEFEIGLGFDLHKYDAKRMKIVIRNVDGTKYTYTFNSSFKITENEQRPTTQNH